MPDSNKKKKKISEYRKFRARNNIRYCVSCGKKLNSDCHHFKCNACWKKDKMHEKALKDALGIVE